MIGTLVQYSLYALFWFTIALSVGGLWLVFKRQEAQTLDALLSTIQPWLAGLSLIAAAAPYIGLFGTVWHIIAALSGIGSGNLNVAAIALPIGEALYATLWGLGAAIPALMAHRTILLRLSLLEQAEETKKEAIAQPLKESEGAQAHAN